MKTPGRVIGFFALTLMSGSALFQGSGDAMADGLRVDDCMDSRQDRREDRRENAGDGVEDRQEFREERRD